jgi:RNA polymerase sigma factor (sigma-70 family)
MTNERSDEEWLRLLKQDDLQAGHDLWLALYTYGLNAKYRFQIDDDVVHEALLEAYRRIRIRGIYQFRFACPFLAYCRVILIREIQRLLKKRASAQIETELDEEELDLPNDEEATPADPAKLRALLQPCLNQFTSREREIIDGRYFEGQDPQVIADRLGLSRNNVNVIIHRVRQKLRKCLEDSGYREFADVS